jgi:dihydroorotate dehydrogenase (NAD+) catalytic subunit
VNVPAAVDLGVQLGALRPRNPIIAASGTFGYSLELASLGDLSHLGGVVFKGLSREPTDGAPTARLCETPSGILNAVGLQNIGVRAFVREKLPGLRRYESAVVANVFGYSIEDYVEVIRILEDAEGLAAYELNISCPNIKPGGMQLGRDAGLAAEVTEAARKAAARRRLWVKLSPLVADTGVIGHALETAGADALTVANTYLAMSVDYRTRRSRIGSLTGGLSGAAIRPLTIRQVLIVRNAVRIRVIRLGGIECPEDVIEYLVIGATAVQVGTASLADPTATERIAGGLANFWAIIKILTISDLEGTMAENTA